MVTSSSECFAKVHPAAEPPGVLFKRDISTVKPTPDEMARAMEEGLGKEVIEIGTVFRVDGSDSTCRQMTPVTALGRPARMQSTWQLTAPSGSVITTAYRQTARSACLTIELLQPVTDRVHHVEL